MHTLLAALLSLWHATPAIRPAQGEEAGSRWGRLEVCETWDTGDGLPQCSVNDVLQTRDGFLWIATHGGLARFDGAEFRSFGAATPGLSAARVTRLLESSSGDLWIGASNGVARYRDGRFQRIAAPDRWGTGWVTALAEDREGTVWVAGRELFRVREDALEAVPTGLAGLTVVTDLLATAEGALLAATDRGLVRLLGGQVELLIEDQEPDFRHLVADARGRIWGYGGRLELFCLGDVLVRFPQTAADLPDAAPKTHLRDALLDASGQLLFVGDTSLWRLRDEETAQGVVVRVRLEPVAALGLDGPTTSIAGDRDGNVWVGRSWHGLQRLNRKPFQLFSGPGKPNAAVWSLYGDGEDGVVAQLLDGGFLAVDRSLEPRWLPFTWPALPSVCAGSDGTTWCVEGDELVRRSRSGEELARVPAPISAPELLSSTADGALWVAGPRELARYDGGLARVLPWHDTEPVHTALATPDGGAWLLSNSALARWDGTSIERFGAADGFPEAELRGLVADPDGTVWVTTYGRGLARLREGQVTCFDARQGLLDDYLGGLQAVADGRFYVNSNRGVLVLTRADIAAFERGALSEIPCRLLATGEGSGARSQRTADGLLWFPTMDGLAVLDPTLDRAGQLPPRLLVDGLSVDGVELDPSAGLVLPPGDGDVELRYVAPFFGEPGGVRYRFQLEGHDRGWVDAGAARKATYRSLPPGDHVFRVAASGGSGEWGEQTLTFELRPHFHQTLWFPAAIGLLLLLAGLGLHWARMKTLRAHSRALQAEIKERKAAEEVRRRAEDQLRESTKLEAVGRLAGGIAHDFNNVLTAILGHVELLRMQSEILSPGDIVGHAEAIESCSTKASSLTHQLLAFSRRQVLRPRVVDVNAIVLGLQKLLTHLLPEGIELRIETAPDTGFVRADPSQLEQVVMNLVLNARDAMPEGGKLVVETRRERAVSHGEVRQHAAISVEDDGLGIHPDDLPHVFEPFFTTKGAGGTGLGLASVHGIVMQSGGQVMVDSEPGRGTSFRVLLPSIEDAAPADEPDHVPVAEHRGSETILVCDDYDPVRSVTRRTLEAYGYTVLVADHPARALELARATQRPLALLVTDFSMPGMTGRELADRMLFEHSHLRVLFISGYTANVALQRQVVDDEVAFLPKPFSPEDLARRVREVLDGARNQDRTSALP